MKIREGNIRLTRDQLFGTSVDVEVRNEGTIFLFVPETPEARAWIDENVSDPLYFGDALAVEHRYARDLAAGMMSDGLVLGP